MSDRLTPEPMPRRDFLGLAGLWSAAVAIVGSLIGMARLPKPSVLPEAGRRFRIGRPEDFPTGTEEILSEEKILVRSTPQGIAAISLVCTHLGCIVSHADTGFACPCHGSAFGPNGEVGGGPAPRGLRWLEVSRGVDGRLVVDADREVSPGTWCEV